MKRAVATLEGPLLDAAVAKAEGLRFCIESFAIMNPDPVKHMACWLLKDGDDRVPKDFSVGPYRPSTDWSVGGEIIEREHICTWWQDADGWNAGYDLGLGSGGQDGWLDADHWMLGKTPLIAGLRAYLAKTFGEEVELP